MTHQDLRKLSKQPRSGNPNTFESLNAGSLQRIADAVELMAQDTLALKRKIERQDLDLKYLRSRLATEQRRTAALRGHIKRLKRTIAELTVPPAPTAALTLHSTAEVIRGVEVADSNDR
jgi:hypothetical protein